MLINGTENVTCRRKVNERKKENKNSEFGVVPPKRIHYSGCKNSYAEDPTNYNCGHNVSLKCQNQVAAITQTRANTVAPATPMMTLCALLLNGLVQAVPNVSAVQAV